MKLAARVLIIGVLVGVLTAFFAFGWNHYLTLDFLRTKYAGIHAYQAHHYVSVLAIFTLIYIGSVAASIPGAAVLTLAAGALFGLLWGTLIVSFASTVGATLAFWVARFLLRESIQARYGDKLKRINESFSREGAYYLFTLRLVPVFPFFLVNLVMGLTPIRTWTYYWVTQVGALAGTVVYVNAGTQLARVTSLQSILSPSLIGSFILLAVFPYIARAILVTMNARRVYRGYRRPRAYDRNVIVIGGGAAGLMSAYISAMVRAKVTLIEKRAMGGDCLNFGCVPSKALLRAAKLIRDAQQSGVFGIRNLAVDYDFADVMAGVQRVVSSVAPHDSEQRYAALGVDVVHGAAEIIDPWTVQVVREDGSVERLRTRTIIIAAGAEPDVPAIPGLKEAGYLTSETIWALRKRPQHLIILGGGPLGLEFAQAFARLSVRVTVVELGPRVLFREDPEVSERILRRFHDEGVDVRVNTRIRAVSLSGDQKVLVCTDHQGAEVRIEFDQILVAAGRRPRVSGYGLEALGVRVNRALEVNEALQTNFPNIYGCGDVASPYQFTHIAGHMAWYAAVNGLFGGLLWLRGGRFRIDYTIIPQATFTDPEIARVGLNENEARKKSIPYDVITYDLAELDRAIIDGTGGGFVKILTRPGKDKILGVTIVGERAADIIAEYVLAMKKGLGLKQVLRTIHIYPTLAEANKYAAGAWAYAHSPVRILALAARYHAWRRS